MKRKVKVATALSVFGTLLGCAQILPSEGTAQIPASRAAPERTPVKIAAGPVRPQGASGADVLFSVGRYAHSAGQLEQAAQRYTQALELHPTHVGALNGLAVIHAQAGRTEEALALFARAMQLAPQAAHLHNNMGYALMRAGRLDEAGVRLRQAQALDPASVQTAQNIALLAQESSQRLARADDAPAPQDPVAAAAGPQLVAVAPSVYELRLPAMPEVVQAAVAPERKVAVQVASLNSPSRAPPPTAAVVTAPVAAAVAVPAAVATNARVAAAITAPVVAAVAVPVSGPVNTPMAVAAPARQPPALTPNPAVAVVSAALPALAATAGVKPEPVWIRHVAAPAAPLAANALKGIRLEVSNGAGITNLARRTADRLAATGVVTTRLTNLRPYRQARTEVQFLAGQDLSAQALQKQLPVETRAVASSRLERGVQMRLVLGRDVAGRTLTSWLESAQAPVLAQVQGGGWMLV